MNGGLRALGQNLDLLLMSCDVDVVAAGKRPNIEYFVADGRRCLGRDGG
ncbi:hypothetical protein HanXRQr2_Chr08g0361141 [Helianthus annuus]|uniref:Uncharacterized protein n=1 Tax=Helianthus annuus TaxID=4232 RepID=A0A9K3NED6_HELAN|nr:hypothetical protein HanXRQr2_Chr08g0361141 [Helianthus annuus]KAJ0903382.1 hypothetical protein HanPSC8_Chr08g0348421 [Helianthus annuus]